MKKACYLKRVDSSNLASHASLNARVNYAIDSSLTTLEVELVIDSQNLKFKSVYYQNACS